MNNPNEIRPQTPSDPQILEAGELVLRDAAGKVGAKMTATPIGSKLALYGESGEERISFSVSGEQPGVILRDAQGQARATLTVGDDGPTLALEDTGGKLRTMLTLRGGEAFLALNDTSGKPRAALCLRREEPCLYLYDAGGKPRVFLGIAFDEPLLHLSDATGKRGTRLGGTRSCLGYAALVCWAALLLLAPAIVRAQPGDPMELLGGVLTLGGVLLTAFWVRYRRLWWKTKGRAIASDVDDYEARDSKRRESE